MTVHTDRADCHAAGPDHFWSYNLEDWSALIGPPSFPLTPAQIADAWGFGFVMGGVPMLMALAAAFVLQQIRR